MTPTELRERLVLWRGRHERIGPEARRIEIEQLGRVIDAAGWQLVPKVATEEMVEAYCWTNSKSFQDDWTNLLTAAPSPLGKEV